MDKTSKSREQKKIIKNSYSLMGYFEDLCCTKGPFMILHAARESVITNLTTLKN